MKVFGIDQSLTGTGLTILNNEKLLYSGIIKSKNRGVKRLIEIKGKLLDIAKLHTPDYIVMEGYGYMTKGRAFELGELGGIIKVMFTELGIEPIVVHPSHLKKFITGKGNADKSVMLVSIYKKYGIEFDNHNIGDSFGLAKVALNAMLTKQGKKDKKDFNKEEWSVIKEYIK